MPKHKERYIIHNIQTSKQNSELLAEYGCEIKQNTAGWLDIGIREGLVADVVLPTDAKISTPEAHVTAARWWARGDRISIRWRVDPDSSYPQLLIITGLVRGPAFEEEDTACS